MMAFRSAAFRLSAGLFAGSLAIAAATPSHAGSYYHSGPRGVTTANWGGGWHGRGCCWGGGVAAGAAAGLVVGTAVGVAAARPAYPAAYPVPYPAPVYVAPAPVVYAPPPVVYAPGYVR